ncbi:hypothetical protein Q4519_07720 [Motilimonas sp. 1_MG-2023]|uniref:hypothetical protein n=1 Tax=Motilimonas sp. 1_MG-2023 TaxID=3062672 RepID=UPI0026E30A96|nr:hypothetical protein [Motilimonas sp. 1_MG-2023]MDO6525569.1 hypothetical protein [Motilimonas sp. 1_MG-2023]
MNETITQICDFLHAINLPFSLTSIENESFLPGVSLNQGALQIDIDKLKYAGDILHEAGHIAVCEPIYRAQLQGDVYKNGLRNGRQKQAMHGEEIAAIAWSVAAVKRLNLPMKTIFHDDGYKGASHSLINAFDNGGIFGQPLLDVWEMTSSEHGFPIMKKWIREHRWIHELPTT